jgi:hypothetical protein
MENVSLGISLLGCFESFLIFSKNLRSMGKGSCDHQGCTVFIWAKTGVLKLFWLVTSKLV